jgi:hypothetical protein
MRRQREPEQRLATEPDSPGRRQVRRWTGTVGYAFCDDGVWAYTDTDPDWENDIFTGDDATEDADAEDGASDGADARAPDAGLVDAASRDGR